jgi:hypothetical protein
MISRIMGFYFVLFIALCLIGFSIASEAPTAAPTRRAPTPRPTTARPTPLPTLFPTPAPTTATPTASPTIPRTFNNVTLSVSTIVPQQPLTFTIGFDVARDVNYTEEFVFSLPKFYGPASNDVVISPNTILEASWVCANACLKASCVVELTSAKCCITIIVERGAVP